MPNTFTQIYLHIIFAVKNRDAVIHESWRPELFKYINTIIQKRGSKLIVINGMPDHVHLLIGYKPETGLPDLIRDVKAVSSRFINEKKFVRGKFEWQTGYGAFSVSQSKLNEVVSYINNQQEHHRKKTFTEEYSGFLKAYGIQFQDNYVFRDL